RGVGWNEMVPFVAVQGGIGIAVLADLFDFQAMGVAGFRPDRFPAPPRITNGLVNIFLRDFRISCARSPPRIGINVRRPDTWPDRFTAGRRSWARRVKLRANK